VYWVLLAADTTATFYLTMFFVTWFSLLRDSTWDVQDITPLSHAESSRFPHTLTNKRKKGTSSLCSGAKFHGTHFLTGITKMIGNHFVS
jgi:hypothetical protein